MSKILNLVIMDNHDPGNPPSIFVESFQCDDNMQDSEKELREAIREFINSDAEDAKKAVSYASGCFNWGDAMSSVPDSVFANHGLIRLNQNATDVFVDHDEILCDPESYGAGDIKQISNFINVKKPINEVIIDGKKDIGYWQRGNNLFAENIADEIAEKNDKLKKLLKMETITADFIKNLISAEKSDELIVIYESILDELTTSDEKMVLGSVYNASVELDNLSERTYVMALCMVELEDGFDIRQINKVLFVLPNEGKYMPIEFHANNTSAYGFIDSEYYQTHDYDANFIADMVNAILEDKNMESLNCIYTTPDGQYFYMGYFND